MKIQVNGTGFVCGGCVGVEGAGDWEMGGEVAGEIVGNGVDENAAGAGVEDGGDGFGDLGDGGGFILPTHGCDGVKVDGAE